MAILRCAYRCSQALVMLSELALVDWVALLIAFVLLGVAATATYLAHTTEPTSVLTVKVPGEVRSLDAASYRPIHALASSLDDSAGHNASSKWSASKNHTVPPPPTGPATPQLPPPPKLTSVGRASDPEQVIDLDSDREETVAERAKRLRATRPIAESERPVSTISEAPEPLTYQHVTSGDREEHDVSSGFPSRGPGFFADPVGRHELRYWNGTKWTEYVKEGADRFVDPL